MTALFLVALLPLFGAVADSACTTSSCTTGHDETSLLQVKSNLEPGNQRSEQITLVSTSDSEFAEAHEVSETKLTEQKRMLAPSPKPAHTKVKPKAKAARRHMGPMPVSLAKQLSNVTFVATVGKNKWMFWFRHALKNARDKAELEDVGTSEHATLDSDIYAGGGCNPWLMSKSDLNWLPNAWQDYRDDSWQDAALAGIANGNRWANIGRSMDWSNFGGMPSWRNDWEIAAALPLDPLCDDDFMPGMDDVAATEAYIGSKWNDASDYVDAAAVDAGVDATAYADSAYTDAWLANKAMEAPFR